MRNSVANVQVDTAIADFSSLADVRELASDIRVRFDRLDVLINNAAIITRSRETSSDGFEMQWAVNYLAPFLLTNLLVDLLLKPGSGAGAGAGAAAETDAAAGVGTKRIVNVSSRVHAGADAGFVDDGEAFEPSADPYNSTKVYARTKLANILFTFELARRLAHTPVTANCLHPGVVATNLLADFRGTPRLLTKLVRRHARTTDEGSETSVYLSLSSELDGATGGYYVDCKAEEPSEAARDGALAARLWALSAQQVGLDTSI